MNQDFYHKLCEIVGSDNAYLAEPMKKHTTFRIGGPADYFVTPHAIEEIQKIVAVCKEEKVPYYILGNGSNLLVGDKGYRGVILQLFKNFSDINIEEDCMRVKAGALLSRVSKKALEAGLSGLEFAGGIPGTAGGAVMMNAGAYGGEMKQVVERVKVLDQEGQVRCLEKEELEMGYRTSIIEKKNYMVLEAELSLHRGNREDIQERMNELKEQRVSKQPLEFPSAGSTFKRPEGYFAGKLIMDAGLRGYTVGGAQIAEKHCGFVVNRGEATAADVVQLMKDVSRIVQEKFQVILEPEVKMLGEF